MGSYIQTETSRGPDSGTVGPLGILQLGRAAGQRDVAHGGVVPDADRSVGVLVHHLQILEVGAHWYDHPTTRLQLIKQRLRDIRCRRTHMDRVVGGSIWKAKPAICSIENSPTS